jgi:two-component system response regulator PilR (NtrC family)
MLSRLAARAGLAQAPRLASVTLKYLQSYPFPGNVRELENILERALAFSSGEVINVEDLGLRPAVPWSAEQERDPASAAAGGARDGGDPWHGDPVGGDRRSTWTSRTTLRQRPAAAAAMRRRPVQMVDGVPDSLPDYLDELEREAIEKALARTRYNRTAAARLLGITFRALRYRMQRLGLN